MIEIRNGEGKILHLDPTAKTITEALENVVRVNRGGVDVNEKAMSPNGKIEAKGFKTWDDFLDRIQGKVEIDSVGLVHVKGDVDLNDLRLTEMPVQFGKVTGDFDCSYNNLKTLAGSPSEVGGSFYCHSSKLIDLTDSPLRVGRDFDCSVNQLTTLEGGPEYVGGSYDCSYNKLTDLNGSPDEVGGYFKCTFNKLKTLAGGPEKVGGNYICLHNPTVFTREDVDEFSQVRGKMILK